MCVCVCACVCVCVCVCFCRCVCTCVCFCVCVCVCVCSCCCCCCSYFETLTYFLSCCSCLCCCRRVARRSCSARKRPKPKEIEPQCGSISFRFVCFLYHDTKTMAYHPKPPKPKEIEPHSAAPVALAALAAAAASLDALAQPETSKTIGN